MSRAWIVVDLGFGDAGKGTITDYLVRRSGARLVVRFNGGAQAGHNVVTDDGRRHTFAQLGAGTFVPGVRTHLMQDFVLHPTALLLEAHKLSQLGVPDALDRLTICAQALVITPHHQALNQLRELARGAGRHGTCGVGVGETVRDALDAPDRALRVKDLFGDPASLARKLAAAQERCVEEARAAGLDAARLVAGADAWLEAVAGLAQRRELLSKTDQPVLHALRDGPVVFEGAQGVLLDEWRGFHPHTTWSTCTPLRLCDQLRALGYRGEIERIGVIRTYLTRHGAGPFPTEDERLSQRLPELHNHDDGWQGKFRIGWPDAVLLRYAIAACGGLEGLALTHTDRLSPDWRIATAYKGVDSDALTGTTQLRLGELMDLDHQSKLTAALRQAVPVWQQLGPSEADYIDAIERISSLPVRFTSSGPTASAKRAR